MNERDGYDVRQLLCERCRCAGGCAREPVAGWDECEYFEPLEVER